MRLRRRVGRIRLRLKRLPGRWEISSSWESGSGQIRPDMGPTLLFQLETEPLELPSLHASTRSHSFLGCHSQTPFHAGRKIHKFIALLSELAHSTARHDAGAAAAGCSSRGYCGPNGTCVCDRGWSGPSCDTSGCPEDCSGNGMCLVSPSPLAHLYIPVDVSGESSCTSPYRRGCVW